MSHRFLTFCTRNADCHTYLYWLEESFAAHAHRCPLMLACLYWSLMFLPRVMFPESHVCPKLDEVSDFKADTILRSFQWAEKHVEHNPLSNITQPRLVGQLVSYSNMWTTCCSLLSHLKRCWLFSRYFLYYRHSGFVDVNVLRVSSDRSLTYEEVKLNCDIDAWNANKAVYAQEDVF